MNKMRLALCFGIVSDSTMTQRLVIERSWGETLTSATNATVDCIGYLAIGYLDFSNGDTLTDRKDASQISCGFAL